MGFMFDDSNLLEEALKLIKSEKDVYVSIASLWEIAIKQSLGKLDIPSHYRKYGSSNARYYYT